MGMVKYRAAYYYTNYWSEVTLRRGTAGGMTSHLIWQLVTLALVVSWLESQMGIIESCCSFGGQCIDWALDDIGWQLMSVDGGRGSKRSGGEQVGSECLTRR